jgi:hypothetical protein
LVVRKAKDMNKIAKFCKGYLCVREMNLDFKNNYITLNFNNKYFL